MIIREVKVTDLERIAEIYHQNIGKVPLIAPAIEPLTETDWARWFINHPKDRYPAFVLEESGRIIGWTSLNKYSPYPVYQGVVSRSTYICSSEQGKGFGLQLRIFVQEKAKELGYHTLLSYVYEGNQKSIRLCEKENMQLWGRLPKAAYCGKQRWDILIYGITLAD